MFVVALAAIMATVVLALCRALTGPTIFDRILAANMFGTKTVLLIAVYGFLTERPEFLDLALVYVLINFIGLVAVLHFVRTDPAPVDTAQTDALAADAPPVNRDGN